MPRNINQSAPMSVPRRARITPKDLNDHGCGCQGCESVETGHSRRRNHPEERRKRIEAAMEESEAGKDRLQKTKEQMDDRTAKAGEEMIEKEEAASESDAKKTEANTSAIIKNDDMDEDKVQGKPEVELQEMPSSSADRMLSTPDRKPAENRRGPVDDG